MQVAVTGRRVSVNDGLRNQIGSSFRKLSRRVSPLARLEIELDEERNPAIAESQIVTATLFLKGTKLHAKSTYYEMQHAINLCAEELDRQVDRYEAKKMKRHERKVARELKRRGAAAEFS